MRSWKGAQYLVNFLVAFGLVVEIQWVKITSGYQSPVSTDLTSTQSMRMESTRRAQWRRDKFQFCLQLMELYIQLVIFRLVEYVPFNRLHGMSGFHYHMSSQFP